MVTNLVYNVVMPINTEKSKVIQVVVTQEDYQRVRRAVAAIKHSGHKITVSKYVAGALIERLNTEELFMEVHHD